MSDPQIPESSSVGRNFTAGHYCVIGENVHIGDDVALGNMCVIEKNTRIGDKVEMGHLCIVGEDCQIGRQTELKSHVELRKATVVGAECYIDSGVKSSGMNRVGDNVTLRYDCIIARGCDIGDRSYICPQVMTNNVDHKGNEIGGAHVGADAFIGTNVTLGAGLRIAAKTIVGSKAMVTRDIEEAGVYVGVPATLQRKL
jgi:UDP-3-O-[3-hydroxymyristoyl] glucosamine N-acyltransferase